MARQTQYLSIFLTMAMVVSPPPVMATGMQDLAEIDRAVANFAGAAIGEAGGAQSPVDRNLRLASCDQSLALAWYGQARTAVRVTCGDAGGWRLFVPVLASARNGVTQAGPVVSRRDILRVEAGGAGFRITRSGEALEPGAIGDTIRVRIEDGTRQGRVVTARVLEAGRVRVPLS